MLLTVQRLTMDYNENGVYFDGEITYDTDGLLVYGVTTCFLFIMTLTTIMVWKTKRLTNNEELMK